MSATPQHESDNAQREKDALETAKNILETEEEGPFNVAKERLIYNLSGVYKFIEKLDRDTLWTVDMVKKMDALSKKLSKLKEGDEYEVTAFDGKTTETLHVPKLEPKHELQVEIVAHQVLSQVLDENGEFKPHTNKYRRIPFFIVARDMAKHLSKKSDSPKPGGRSCLPEPGEGPWNDDQLPWDDWNKRWESGEYQRYSNHLKQLVEQRWSKLQEVDSIVCFALGYIETGETRFFTENCSVEYEFPKRYVQHLAASTIRETLYELAQKDWDRGKHEGGVRPQPVPIIAQDPAYCEQCKRVLRETLNIIATELCDGFLRIRKNTLVLCMSPGTAVLGVVGDITRSFDGPLAMLCNEIRMETERWDGNSKDAVEPWLKWDKWDGVTPSTEREKRIPNDYTTKSLAEYSKICSSVDFGDYKDLKGITHKEFQTKYSDWPLVKAHITEREQNLTEDPEGMRKRYKDKYGDDYDAHMKFATAKTPLFGELKFYVKEN